LRLLTYIPPTINPSTSSTTTTAIPIFIPFLRIEIGVDEFHSAAFQAAVFLLLGP
jgi:hypothetical protein